eukprot:m.210907 g.210907  ORF g.210907 m.210907 type:complete len:759 (-) comp33095_c0_seq1:211-2487(-)
MFVSRATLRVGVCATRARVGVRCATSNAKSAVFGGRRSTILKGLAIAGGATFGLTAAVAYCEPQAFQDIVQQGTLSIASLRTSEKELSERIGADTVAELPLISLDEVKKHKTEAEQIWVTYKGMVYDVTSFADHHPGGKELLLTAGGLDLGHFFDNYLLHEKTDKAQKYLDGMVIGRLSDADAQLARAETTPAAHVTSRFSVLHHARTSMLFIISSVPVWLGVRTFVRLVGVFSPTIAGWIASVLPVSVPGYAGAKKLAAIKPNGETAKVAVIGGGVAGSGAAYTLTKDGYEVTVYEARKTCCGNARSFEWDINGRTVTSCVSVTAWPAILYKNYVALLEQIDVKTTPMPLSWFLYSKVPGSEGYLWAADPAAPEGSLRQRFKEDFRRYDMVQKFVRRVTNFYTLEWFGDEVSMYTPQTGLGIFNPLNVYPLYSMCRLVGISQEWWDVVFTPHYTASFLSDKLDNMCAVTAPLIEVNIPLNPKPENSEGCVITSCETWADAGAGIRETFAKMTAKSTVHVDTRVLDVKILENGMKRVFDEHGNSEDYDKVIFACQSTAVGNMHKAHNWYEDRILATPEYADDHHPGTGHMHAIMHNDSSIIAPEFEQEIVQRASNYVEITQEEDGSLNIENTYNFGVQSPGVKWLQDIPSTERPPMLISHALGAGKVIDPAKTLDTGNHVRAHPLYSGWNIMTMLSLRLVQGRNGIYYCSNWTTPGNTHDMSLLSGIVCAHAIGADYPFEGNVEAKKDFFRLRSLMGI